MAIALGRYKYMDVRIRQRRSDQSGDYMSKAAIVNKPLRLYEQNIVDAKEMAAFLVTKLIRYQPDADLVIEVFNGWPPEIRVEFVRFVEQIATCPYSYQWVPAMIGGTGYEAGHFESELRLIHRVLIDAGHMPGSATSPDL